MQLKSLNVLRAYKRANFARINAPPTVCVVLHMRALKESMEVLSVFQELEDAVGMRLRPCGAHAMWTGTTNVSATDSQEQATTVTGLQLDHVGLCLDLSA